MADFDDKKTQPEPDVAFYEEELPLASARDLYLNERLNLKPKIEVDLENREFRFLLDRTPDGRVETHPIMNERGLVYVFDLDKWAFVSAPEAGENVLDPVADYVKGQIDLSVENEPDLDHGSDSIVYDFDMGDLDANVDDLDIDESIFENLSDLDNMYPFFEEEPGFDEVKELLKNPSQLAHEAIAEGRNFEQFVGQLMNLTLKSGDVGESVSINLDEFRDKAMIAWDQAMNEDLDLDSADWELDDPLLK